jgi:hypothetical protein
MCLHKCDAGAKVFDSSVGGDILKATIPGLKPNSKYRITVSAQNRAGTGLPQVANGQTKPGPPPNCRAGIKPANPVNLTAIPDGLDRMVLVWTTIPDGVCIDDFTVSAALRRMLQGGRGGGERLNQLDLSLLLHSAWGAECVS